MGGDSLKMMMVMVMMMVVVVMVQGMILEEHLNSDATTDQAQPSAPTSDTCPPCTEESQPSSTFYSDTSTDTITPVFVHISARKSLTEREWRDLKEKFKEEEGLGRDEEDKEREEEGLEEKEDRKEEERKELEKEKEGKRKELKEREEGESKEMDEGNEEERDKEDIIPAEERNYPELLTTKRKEGESKETDREMEEERSEEYTRPTKEMMERKEEKNKELNEGKDEERSQEDVRPAKVGTYPKVVMVERGPYNSIFPMLLLDTSYNDTFLPGGPVTLRRGNGGLEEELEVEREEREEGEVERLEREEGEIGRIERIGEVARKRGEAQREEMERREDLERSKRKGGEVEKHYREGGEEMDRQKMERGNETERDIPESRGASMTDCSDGEFPVMCGNYTLTPGSCLTLRSPNFPHPYPTDFSCQWQIQATGIVRGLVMSCRVMTLLWGNSLTVTTNEGHTLTYKGNLDPFFEVLQTDKLVVDFTALAEIGVGGFWCTVRQEPEWVSYPMCGLAGGVEMGVEERETKRMIGGHEATPHHVPWQALVTSHFPDSTLTCGGSLIYPDYIATAAHCVTKTKNLGNGRVMVKADWVRVNLGLHNRFETSKGLTVDVRDKVHITVRPEQSYQFDLAIIRLPYKVPLSDRVNTICLPPRSSALQNIQGTELTLSGWGYVKYGKPSSVLHVLESRKAMNYNYCRKEYPTFITDHHFCTYALDEKHICVGDSGGPAMSAKEGRRVLSGVMSFVASRKCDGRKPDGHTMVGAFIDWLEEITGRDVPN